MDAIASTFAVLLDTEARYLVPFLVVLFVFTVSGWRGQGVVCIDSFAFMIKDAVVFVRTTRSWSIRHGVVGGLVNDGRFQRAGSELGTIRHQALGYEQVQDYNE